MTTNTPQPAKPTRGAPVKDRGGPATEDINLRVSPRRKRAYKIAAQGKLTPWALEHLDKAAGYDPKKEPDEK